MDGEELVDNQLPQEDEKKVGAFTQMEHTQPFVLINVVFAVISGWNNLCRVTLMQERLSPQYILGIVELYIA